MTNTREEVAYVARAIWESHKNVVGDIWYAPDTSWDELSRNAKNMFVKDAVVAIAASNSQYIPQLVAALERIAKQKHINHDASINAAVSYIAYIAQEALNNLPDEVKQ